MASGSSQLVLNFRLNVRPEVVDFASKLYGQRSLFNGCTLYSYHKQLCLLAKDVMSDYFNSLNSLSLSADAGNRLTTVCEAAWLLSSIHRCGSTVDEVFSVGNDRVAEMVAQCTPDSRMFAPRRVEAFVGQLPNLSVDAKLLMLADQCLTVSLKKLDKHERGDIHRIICGLSSLSSFPAVADRISQTLKLLGAQK